MAWSLPAVSALGVMPAFAASNAPIGLQGWVNVSKRCAPSSSDTQGLTLSIDGSGTRYPDGIYGLYVFNTTATSVVSDASITFYLPEAITMDSWSITGGAQGWSAPTRISVQNKPGYIGYITTYDDSYGWTFNAASSSRDSFSIATGVPHFAGTGSYSAYGHPDYCSDRGLRVYAKRCVSVNGSQICFERDIYL